MPPKSDNHVGAMKLFAKLRDAIVAAALIAFVFAGVASFQSCHAANEGRAGGATGHEDGAIAALVPVLNTERSEYFKLTYWSDGLRVTGYLGRPKNGTSRPAVIFNRGGNEEYRALSGPEIVPFVEAGFVAVASQYRGNRGGDGREEFGGADVRDVLHLISLLKRLPEVDSSRIGMVGFSRGGMMTYLALKEQSLHGKHDIKVAVTVGGVTDLLAWAEERPEMLETYKRLIGTDEMKLRERSAVCWPDLINVPLLIQHGEADSSVSVEQSRRLATLMKRAGKVVKLRTYPGEEHPLANEQSGLRETLAWLQEYLAKPGDDFSFNAHYEGMVSTVQAWPR